MNTYDRYERDDASASTKLTYLLVGGGIGAVLALLFAPKSGVELRGDIADATRKGYEKSKETAAQLQERAGEYYEVAKEKTGELYDAASVKAGELYDAASEKAGELGDKARSVAAQSVNPFSAAVEAGKDAYNAEKRRTETKAISEGRPSYPVDNKKKGDA